jgi:hypothetical protein
MSFPKSLKVCSAALMIPFRTSLETARAVEKTSRHKVIPTLCRTGIMVAGIALFFLNHSAAQESASSPDPTRIANNNDSGRCDLCESHLTDLRYIPVGSCESPRHSMTRARCCVWRVANE